MLCFASRVITATVHTTTTSTTTTAIVRSKLASCDPDLIHGSKQISSPFLLRPRRRRLAGVELAAIFFLKQKNLQLVLKKPPLNRTGCGFCRAGTSIRFPSDIVYLFLTANRRAGDLWSRDPAGLRRHESVSKQKSFQKKKVSKQRVDAAARLRFLMFFSREESRKSESERRGGGATGQSEASPSRSPRARPAAIRPSTCIVS